MKTSIMSLMAFTLFLSNSYSLPTEDGEREVNGPGLVRVTNWEAYQANVERTRAQQEVRDADWEDYLRIKRELEAERVEDRTLGLSDLVTDAGAVERVYEEGDMPFWDLVP